MRTESGPELGGPAKVGEGTRTCEIRLTEAELTEHVQAARLVEAVLRRCRWAAEDHDGPLPDETLRAAWDAAADLLAFMDAISQRSRARRVENK